MARPSLFVLAGVNGAGKSSIGGLVARQHGFDWFNPDDAAREFRIEGRTQAAANEAAWRMGVQNLESAIGQGTAYAFETTLGGRSITDRLLAATSTHDVYVWFCSLGSADEHLAGIRTRVGQGGHDIPESDVHRRWASSFVNLARLVPAVTMVSMYDNSRTVEVGDPLPDPLLVAQIADGRLVRPDPHDLAALSTVPDWAKPVLAMALRSED